jgi:hypothetical protein
MPENKRIIPPHADNSTQDPFLAALAQADFSKASQGRSALRARLLQAAGQPQRRGHSLRLALEVSGLALLALFFLFAVTRLMNNQPPVPAATLPAPQPTPTLSATPTPQPLLQTPAPELNLDTDPDTVRLAISQPSWKTLWAQIQLDDYATPGDEATLQRSFSQSWLEKDGRGLVLTSNDSVNSITFSLDIAVRTVLLFDQTNLTIYDKQTGTTQSALRATINQGLHPVIGSAATLDLVYPDFLMILSSEPRLVRMEEMAGCPALVVEWGNSRLWVDTQTGLLLRAERYTGEVGASPLQSALSMIKVQVDPKLDESVFNPPYLNELTFVQGPALAPTGPTATPFSQSSPEGWVYFQAAAQAPFEWKVYQLPAGCLAAGGTSCPEPQQLPGNPNIQITGFYWAPDHSLAVFSDTNNNQIVGFDPQTGKYPRLVQGFFQTQLYWSPDGTRIAALAEATDAYDMKLVMIQRDGWAVHEVPTTLKGEKFVYGWLDDYTLALKIPDIVAKGTPPAWIATDLHPGIYRVDVNTGKADLLPLDAVQPFDASLSPDGKQFVYWKWVDNKASIFVASVDGKDAISTGYEGNYPTWSPDGHWILFRTTSDPGKDQSAVTTLYTMRPDGSGLKKVLASPGYVETAWNADGTRLLVLDVGPEPIAAKSMTVFNPLDGKLVQTVLPSTFEIFFLLGWQP